MRHFLRRRDPGPTDTRLRDRAIRSLLLVVGLFPVVCNAAALSLGQPLTEALAGFRADGLNLLSSSRLITRAHRVTRVPDPALPPLEQVRQLLAPHGFLLTSLRDDSWYITRAPETTPASEATPIEPPAEETLVPLIEEIVVRASHRLASDRPGVASMTTADLATLPSIGRDALRGIASLPGVASSGISAATRVRGGDHNETLYLLDGVPLLEPFHLNQFHSLFSAISGDVLAGIDVYASGFPVRYGGKLSALVDLDLVRPDAPRAVSVDVNTALAGISASGTSGRWQWLGSARRSMLDLTLNSLTNDYGNPNFHDELVRLVRAGERSEWRIGFSTTQTA